MDKVRDDELARLRRENRDLRDHVESMARGPDGLAGGATTRPAGCLSLIGLVVACGVTGLVVFGLLSLYPPWDQVKSQRQELLYSSRWVKDYERKFVGFDFADSEAKKKTNRPAVPSSGVLFDVTDYQIDWSLLWAEWAVACGLFATGVYYIFKPRKTTHNNIQRGKA